MSTSGAVHLTRRDPSREGGTRQAREPSRRAKPKSNTFTTPSEVTRRWQSVKETTNCLPISKNRTQKRILRVEFLFIWSLTSRSGKVGGQASTDHLPYNWHWTNKAWNQTSQAACSSFHHWWAGQPHLQVLSCSHLLMAYFTIEPSEAPLGSKVKYAVKKVEQKKPLAWG